MRGVFFVCLGFGLLLEYLFPIHLISLSLIPRVIVRCIFILISGYFALSAFVVLVNNKTPFDPAKPTVKIVKDGSFRFFRNPLYLSLLLLLFGIAVLIFSLWLFITIPILFVLLLFNACLFDQSMLCHILMCMRFLKMETADLLCIDAFQGIEPYHGIGQLSPDQPASMYDRRQPLTEDQFLFAERVDRAFALQDRVAFKELSDRTEAPLPWVPAAVTRWIEEKPDKTTGLSRLEQLALEAIRSGCETTTDIFWFVSARETPPQFWGDITLWEKINALANQEPPLVRIEGPRKRLPQWEGIVDLKLFRVCPIKTNVAVPSQ